MDETIRKDKCELFVMLVKALAWPTFATLVLFIFAKPVTRIFNQIPPILSQSEAITLSGLSLKIDPKLKKKATSDVEAAIAELSSDDIETLLSYSRDGLVTYGDVKYARQKNSELAKNGLVKEHKGKEKDTISYSLTPLGERTKSFLAEIVTAFAQQLAPPAK